MIAKQDELKEFGNNSLKLTRAYTPKHVVQSLEVLYNQMN
jgi:hypothetical protein